MHLDHQLLQVEALAHHRAVEEEVLLGLHLALVVVEEHPFPAWEVAVVLPCLASVAAVVLSCRAWEVAVEEEQEELCRMPCLQKIRALEGQLVEAEAG